MSSSRQIEGPDGLWRQLRAVTASALASGALVPLTTHREELTEGELTFHVRVACNLHRKDAERRRALESAFDPTARGARPNPFLPYDPALYVADITADHVGLLNKFNVLNHHLLVVTREFAPQRSLITPGDFEALGRCLQQLDGLAFYNGGQEAGASQPHKHLQLVPLPLDDTGAPFPLASAWERAPATEGVVSAPGLGFPHGLVRLEPRTLGPDADLARVATELHQRYFELLAHVGLPVVAGQQDQPGPYNLLVTRRWMLLVPRVAEHFEGISLNGLAFAGSLFVRDQRQLEVLRGAGPRRALRAVTQGGAGGPP